MLLPTEIQGLNGTSILALTVLRSGGLIRSGDLKQHFSLSLGPFKEEIDVACVSMKEFSQQPPQFRDSTPREKKAVRTEAR